MNELSPQCPTCSAELKHYTQPYVMGGTIDSYFCTRCQYSVAVLPPPSDTIDPFVTTAPGARDDEWAPSYLVDSDLMME